MIWHDLANKCDGKFDTVFLNLLEEEPNLSPLEEVEQRENIDQVSLNDNNSTLDENVNDKTSLESETGSKQEDNAPSLPSTPSTTRSVQKRKSVQDGNKFSISLQLGALKQNQGVPDDIANYKSAHQEDHQAEQESQLQERMPEEKHECAKREVKREREEREERKHDCQFQLMLLMAMTGKNPGMENSENPNTIALS
ncbi:hypothetical protein HK096_008948, partial [Nowakowskiella sp. JEL0078]